MTCDSAASGGAMVFAVDEPTRAVGRELIQLADDRAQLVLCNAGEALRTIHRHEPRIVFVCAATPAVEPSARIIQVLHERRPRLPLLAIAGTHDESIERAVRSAGAGYYFALDAESERLLLRQTLDTLGVLAPVPSNHPPPRSRGAPAGRAAP